MGDGEVVDHRTGMFTTNNCRFSMARNVITQQSRPHPTSDKERERE